MLFNWTVNNPWTCYEKNIELQCSITGESYIEYVVSNTVIVQAKTSIFLIHEFGECYDPLIL